MESSHKHLCPRCDLVWEHPDNCGEGVKGGCTNCHTCPRCRFEKMSFSDRDTYTKYFGRRKPDIIFVGVHCYDENISNLLGEL